MFTGEGDGDQAATYGDLAARSLEKTPGEGAEGAEAVHVGKAGGLGRPPSRFPTPCRRFASAVGERFPVQDLATTIDPLITPFIDPFVEGIKKPIYAKASEIEQTVVQTVVATGEEPGSDATAREHS